MSDSTAEIKGAAARLAAAMPSGGKRLTMEFGTVVGVHDTALDVMPGSTHCSARVPGSTQLA